MTRRAVARRAPWEARPLHLLTQDDQGYYSQRRCCERCGRALASALPDEIARRENVWTDRRSLYERPPAGYHRCTDDPSQAVPRAADRRGVDERTVSRMGYLQGELLRDVDPALWGEVSRAIAPVCNAVGVDVEHEDVGLLLGEALLSWPPAPHCWGVYVNPVRVWVSRGYQSRVLRRGSDHAISAWPELVAPAVVALATVGADWRRHPSALRETVVACATVVMAAGMCGLVEPRS